MANPFYNYSGAFIAGTLARAEAEAAEFNAVQAGFALLATEGVDTGTPNTYVVTTGGAPTVVYADGNNVSFKALNANSLGASTINVNGVGPVALLRSSGTALQAGDILPNVWYTAVYNSTFSGFTLLSTSTVAVFPGTISASAPVHKVGLVAAGGVANQVVPIDATYAIDQSIAPTWTGVHTFSATPVMNAGLTVTGAAITSSAGLTVSAGTSAVQALTATSAVIGSPTGGNQGTGTINATGLFINGVAVGAGATVTSITGTANQIAASASTGAVTLSLPQNVIIPTGGAGSNALTVTGAASSGNSFGLSISAGTTSADSALTVANQASSAVFLKLFGDGHGTLGPSASLGLSWNAAGNVTFAAPGSGTALTVGSSTTGITNATLGLMSIGVGVNFSANTAEMFAAAAVNIGSTASSTTLWANGHNAIMIASTGAVSVAAPSSGNALTLTGVAGTISNAPLLVQGAATSGQSHGIHIQAGTTSADTSLAIANAANTVEYFNVDGDGSVVVGSPTGGSQGLGTINATGLFINGVAVGTGVATTGTFSAGTTGLTGATVAASWTKVGNAVILDLAVPSGTTSSATTFTITGLPAAIQPTTTKYISTGITGLNNGGIVLNVTAQISGSVITLLLTGNSAGWTATGGKTLGDLTHGATLVWGLS